MNSIYSEQNHDFSINKEIIYSFDVCGSCEAHGILYSMKNNIIYENNNIVHSTGVTVDNAALLKYLPVELIENNIYFIKCPKLTA